VSKFHNKKRNVGLLYAFLVNTISTSLVEGDQKKSNKALKILKKHFKPGTELYKEFRLVNALNKTSTNSQSVAANILSEAKLAARSRNLEELDKQKSLLIKDINYMLNDEHFYDQQIAEYKILANTYMLINGWRNKDTDLQKLALYEETMLNHLVAQKQESDVTTMSENTPGENRILMKIMMKKLNEKYSDTLTTEQKSLLRAYAFSSANNDDSSIKMKMNEIKQKLIQQTDDYVTNNSQNIYINKKLNEVADSLKSEDCEQVNDEQISKFMLYMKLASELSSKENE